MTLLEHNVDPRTAAADIVRVQVKWNSMRREACGSFVKASAMLMIETLDGHRAMIEMWVEDGGQRRTVQDRTILKAHTTIEHGLMHIDAGDACRVTIELTVEPRLLYAQSAWLECAGFTAGTFDRPTADLSPAPAIAASA